MAKKTYVLDTSVYLTDARSIYGYGNNDIVIPLKVLEEIDGHKKRQDIVGVNARSIIRTLDCLREKGNLYKGIRLARGKGIVRVQRHDKALLPNDLSASHPDHIIIATALKEKKQTPSRKVIVVTRDINMRVVCDSLELNCEDYVHSQVVDDAESVYSGFTEHLVDDQIIDQFYEKEKIFIEEGEKKLHPNQFVMLISNANDKKTALARFKNYNSPLMSVGHFKEGAWGVKPRNKEQLFAMDLLMDSEIDLLTLVGKAGSGKTLLACQIALEGLFQKEYEKVIITRPTVSKEEIGFLPGDLREKMDPWIQPIYQNMSLLCDKGTLGYFLSEEQIEIVPVSFMRGRTFLDSIIIVDEAQNVTHEQMEMIATRIGLRSKMIVCGDDAQIDLKKRNESGLKFLYSLARKVKKMEAITLNNNHRDPIVEDLIKHYEDTHFID